MINVYPWYCGWFISRQKYKKYLSAPNFSAKYYTLLYIMEKALCNLPQNKLTLEGHLHLNATIPSPHT